MTGILHRLAAQNDTEMAKPDFATHFLRGIAHFNSREFWDAHESWEEIWLAAESDVEQFLQGLIQVAAAYHHLKRGTFPGGVRLFDSGLRRLQSFPAGFCDLDRGPMEMLARQHRAWAAERLSEEKRNDRLRDEEYPVLNLVITNRAPSPPLDRW
jgi:predicted metal-dependent hydrolase